MIPKEYRISIVGLMLSVGLWLASLYQLEIIYIWITQDKTQFEFPFYIWVTSTAMARDIFYLVNGISLIVASYSGAVFNVKRMELKLRNDNSTTN